MLNEDLADTNIPSWIAQLRKHPAKKTTLDRKIWMQCFFMDVIMCFLFGDPVVFVGAGKDVRNPIVSVQNVFLMGNIPSLLSEVRFLQSPPIWPWVVLKPIDKDSIGFIWGVGCWVLVSRP
jgi:hypothetical protein